MSLKCNKFDIKELGVVNSEGSVEIKEISKEKIVVICPGGGYHHLAPRESQPIANRFNEKGFSSAIVRYSVLQNHPLPLDEVNAVLKYLHNEGYKNIYLCGFSAGGHLAGHVCATAYKNLDFELNGVVLGYPVVNLYGDKIHPGSRKNLTNDNEELARELSLPNLITEKMPKVFLFTTYNDQAVPFENSLSLINKLREKNISLEAHIYPYGPHGSALADETAVKDGDRSYVNKKIATWFDFAVEFLEN